MTWQRPLSFLVVFLILGLSLSGCGDSNVFSGLTDDDTPEAQLDKGLAAINAGDYETAIVILQDLYQSNLDDPEVRRYLASAFAGQAGFDAITLISILSEDDSGGADQEMFDTIGELFGADVSGNIPDLDNKISDISTALELLAPAGVTDAESRFQAGLYGSVQSVLLVVDILDGADMDSIKNMADSEISAKVSANFNQPVSDTDLTTKGEALVGSLDLVAEAALDLAIKAAQGSADSNDMADEMDVMLVDIGYAGDDYVDQTELTLYLQSL